MTHRWTLKRAFGFACLPLWTQSSANNIVLEVSVCQDATFQLPTSRGAVCSGNGRAPHGVECPRFGDAAVDDCYPYLDSYNGRNCVAKEDAQCVYLEGRNAWGCIFPSIRCLDDWKHGEKLAVQSKCPVWKYESDDASFTRRRDVDDAAVDCSPLWFVKTTSVRELANCMGDIPKEQGTAIPASTYTSTPVLSDFQIKPFFKVLPNSSKEDYVRQKLIAAVDSALLSPTDESESSGAESSSAEILAATPSCTSKSTLKEKMPMLSGIWKRAPTTDMSTKSLGDLETQAFMDETFTPSSVERNQPFNSSVKPTNVPLTSASEHATHTGLKFESKPWSSTSVATTDSSSAFQGFEQKATIATNFASTTTGRSREFGTYLVQNFTETFASTGNAASTVSSSAKPPCSTMNTDVKFQASSIETEAPISLMPSAILHDPYLVDARTEELLASGPYGSIEATVETGKAPDATPTIREHRVLEEIPSMTQMATKVETDKLTLDMQTTTTPTSAVLRTEPPIRMKLPSVRDPGTLNVQTTLQASTEADVVTIASVGISAVALAVIFIAIGSIIVVTIVIFRARCRSTETPPLDSENQSTYDHSLMLTPSER